MRRTRARSSPVRAPLPKRRRGAVEISRRTGETSSLDAPMHGATVMKQSSLVVITCHLPSDRRGSGREPEPQYAFKMSMFSVSCNSH